MPVIEFKDAIYRGLETQFYAYRGIYITNRKYIEDQERNFLYISRNIHDQCKIHRGLGTKFYIHTEEYT